MRPRHLHFKAPWQSQQRGQRTATWAEGGNTALRELPHAWGCALSTSFFLLPETTLSLWVRPQLPTYADPHNHWGNMLKTETDKTYKQKISCPSFPKTEQAQAGELWAQKEPCSLCSCQADRSSPSRLERPPFLDALKWLKHWLPCLKHISWWHTPRSTKHAPSLLGSQKMFRDKNIFGKQLTESIQFPFWNILESKVQDSWRPI